MSRLDNTAATYIENNDYFRPVHFIWMDFVGSPVRCNDSGIDISMAGLAETELNGTYLGITADLAELSTIRVSAGGSDSVTARLSGIKTLDDATLDLIGDESKWKGRTVEVFRIVWDRANAQQGQYEHFYTGYMTDCLIAGSPEKQFIEVTIENYLAAYVQQSNRTYNQTPFNANDQSFQATVSLANGAGNGHQGSTPPSTDGGGKGIIGIVEGHIFGMMGGQQ